MNGSSCPKRDSDEIIARFVCELASRDSESEQVVDEFSRQFPHLAPEFHEIAKSDRKLDRSAVDVYTPVPEQLGDFRLIRPIGHGGMGIVYEAIQEPLERRVVVKIIRQGRTLPESRKRFLREQRVLARLHQTHIVPVFAAGQDGPFQYFAMPHIDGVNLHRLIGAARNHVFSYPSGRLPLVAELVETAKEISASPGTAPILTDHTLRERTFPKTQAVPESAPATLPAEQTPVPEELLRPPARLSRDYFRAVARIVSEVAESAHHAHQHGFLHRDLKPSNIMLDANGQSWLIDFGLAGFVNSHGKTGDQNSSGNAAEDLGQTAGPFGTPGYMAPEQVAGRPAEVGTDVWGLGVLLYELSTLRRAFPDQQRKHSSESGVCFDLVSPRTLVRDYPRDLEAICDRALRRNPADRYTSAQLLADDLNRWLRGEPTMARPARTLRRVVMWARRNKAWASLLALLFTVLIGVFAATLKVQHALRIGAEQKAVEASRGQLLMRAHNLVVHGVTGGWSDEAWEYCRRAAEVEQRNDVRDLAAATLRGMDASLRRRFNDIGSTSLQFNSQGSRLLMNAVAGVRSSGSGEIAPLPGLGKIWELATDELHELPSAELGPMVVDNDKPRQLIVGGDQTHLSWIDPQSLETIQQYALPQELLPVTFVKTCSAADGSAVAAIVRESDRTMHVLVWDGKSGQLLRQLAAEGDNLAVSPDGTLFATGDLQGDIVVRSTRREDVQYYLRGRGHEIQVLAFGRDPRSAGTTETKVPRSGWLLASGHVGGPVVIWDLERAIPLSYCRGSWYFIWSLAFSSDGATLALGDHQSKVRLWDVMTGQQLLSLEASAPAKCLAFSADGKMLAASGADSGQGLNVWDLESDRGVMMLRGLDSPIANLCFAENGSLLAANTHSFQVGLWNLQTGALQHILELPKSRFADNAAMALSADGTRFAFAAGHQASLWNTQSGERVASWELNEGLVDRLAFSGSDHLLSFRVETRSGKSGPFGSAPFQEDPRVCRIRDLLSAEPTKPVAEISDFCRYVFTASCTPDGSLFVVDGLGGPGGDQRLLKIFDATGREVKEIRTTRTTRDGWLMLDPTGQVMAVQLSDSESATLLKVPSGEFVTSLEPKSWCLSPSAMLWGRAGPPDNPPRGVWLLRSEEPLTPLVGLGLDDDVTCTKFSASGTLLAWGNANGTVSVCDIPTVNRRLSGIGLGW